MRFKELGKSGIKVSNITMGCWVLGGGATWGDNDRKQSVDTIRAAIDAGITTIDTAPAYGKGLSEEIVGEAISGRRSDLIIATKCGVGGGFTNSTYANIIKECEDSLRRLNTDYIDLLQIHWPDFITPVDESMAAMTKLKEQGKIRAIGVSNYDEAMLLAASNYGQIDSIQPQFSLLHTVNRPIMEFAAERSIGSLTYGSLAAGLLTGKYPEKLPDFPEGDVRTSTRMYGPLFSEPLYSNAQKLIKVMREIAEAHNAPVSHVAINYTAQQDFVTTALVGARTPEQAAQNAAAGDWDLTAEELKRIDEAHDAIFGNGLIGKRATWSGSFRHRDIDFE